MRTTVKESPVPFSDTVAAVLLSKACRVIVLDGDVNVRVGERVESVVRQRIVHSQTNGRGLISVEQKSSLPVTVTVCGALQLADVKVRLEGLTVASPASLLVMSMTTFEAGCRSKTTVKVSVVPASLTTVVPDDSVTLKPGGTWTLSVAAP